MFKRHRYSLTLAALAFLIVGFAFHADASFVFFSDQAAWQKALGNAGVQYTFNGIKQDESFGQSPIDFGPFTLTAIGSPPAETDKVVTNPSNQPFNSPFASMFLDSKTGVELDFTHPVLAFGAEFEGGSLAFNFGVFTHHSTLAADVAGPAQNGYFGIISTDPITRIDFLFNGTADTGVIVNFDNIGISSSVPEPSSLMLLGVGAALFAAYACWRLNRSNVQVGTEKSA